DRFFPEVFAWAEVTADQRGIDAVVHGRGVKGDETAFAVPRDADGGLRLPQPELVDRGQHGLNLIADDVAAHHVRLPVDPLPMVRAGRILPWSDIAPRLQRKDIRPRRERRVPV